MSEFHNYDSFQKPLHYGLRSAGYVVTMGLAMLLILAWILTEPLVHCAVCLSDLFRMHCNPRTKGKL